MISISRLSTALYLLTVMVALIQLNVLPIPLLIYIQEVSPLTWLLVILASSIAYLKVIKGKSIWVLALAALLISSVAMVTGVWEGSNLYLEVDDSRSGNSQLRAIYTPVEDYALLKSYSLTVSQFARCKSVYVPPKSLRKGETFEVGRVDLEEMPAGDYGVCASVVDYIADLELIAVGKLHVGGKGARLDYEVKSIDLRYIWAVQFVIWIIVGLVLILSTVSWLRRD